VAIANWDDPHVAEEAVAAATRGECVVCIANTVARAQFWYREVKATMAADAFPVGLLHARFPFFRRAQIEQDWLARLGKPSDNITRPNGCVLIATQIIEQSVDVDADYMISELAPTDMLLQRMGRLWRHNRSTRPRQNPQFTIVAADPRNAQSLDETKIALGEANCRVYAPYVLLRSYEAWAKQKVVVIPPELRELIETTYSEREEPLQSVHHKFMQDITRHRERLRSLAASARDTNYGFPTQMDEEGHLTRYSSVPSTTVLLLSQYPEELGNGRTRVELIDGSHWILDPWKPNFAATRTLHSATLSLPSYYLPKHLHHVSMLPWLQRHFHHPPVPLVLDPRGELCDLDAQEVKLMYSAEIGVFQKTEKQQQTQANDSSASASTGEREDEFVLNDNW
jgi:CRISPR-associated endonuclease/helicase Cas3